jgi:hypothetical protein
MKFSWNKRYRKCWVEYQFENFCKATLRSLRLWVPKSHAEMSRTQKRVVSLSFNLRQFEMHPEMLQLYQPPFKRNFVDEYSIKINAPGLIGNVKLLGVGEISHFETSRVVNSNVFCQNRFII